MDQYLRHHNRRPTFYEPFVTKPVVSQIIKVPDDRYEQDISTLISLVVIEISKFENWTSVLGKVLLISNRWLSSQYISYSTALHFPPEFAKVWKYGLVLFCRKKGSKYQRLLSCIIWRTMLWIYFFRLCNILFLSRPDLQYLMIPLKVQALSGSFERW